MRALLLYMICTFCCFQGYAATYVLNGTGDWSTPGIWLVGGVAPATAPTIADDVQIPNATSFTLTVSGNEACNSLQYAINASSGSFQLNIDGGRLYCQSGFVARVDGADFTLNITNGGELENDGVFSTGINSTTGTVGIAFGSNAVMDNNGNFFVSAGSIAGNVLFDFFGGNGARLEIGGALIEFGSATTTVLNSGGVGNTIVYDGSSIQTINTSFLVYDDISIENTSSVVMGGNLNGTNFLGDLIITNGGVFSMNGNAINSSNGDLVINSNCTLQVSNGSTFPTGLSAVDFSNDSWVAYNNAGGQNVANLFYENLLIEGGGTKTLTSLAPNPSSGTGIAALLLIQGNTTLDFNNLPFTFNSDASRTASLSDLTAGTGSIVNGTNITVERLVDGIGGNLGYRHLATPVIGATLNDWRDSGSGGSSTNGIYMTGFTGSDDPNYNFVSVYTFTEANISNTGDPFNDILSGWTALPTNPGSTTDIGPNGGTNGAFAVYTGGGNFQSHLLQSTGSVFTGDRTIGLTAASSNVAERGWNFIGNPYPSAIDYTAIQASNPTLGSNAFVFDVTSGFNGSWQNNGQIASGQGFFVQTTSSGNITISESHKVTNDVALVRNSANHDRMFIKLRAMTSNYESNAGIDLGDGFDDGIVQLEDIQKFEKGSPYPYLGFDYNNTIYELTRVNRSNLSHAFTLVTETFDSGMHELIFGDFDYARYCIRLTDLETGITTTISEPQSYTFTLNDTATGPRFTLEIDNRVTGLVISNESCPQASDGAIEFAGNPNGTISISNPDGTSLYNGPLLATNTFQGLTPGEYTTSVNLGISGCPVALDTLRVNSAGKALAAIDLGRDTVFQQEGNIPLLYAEVGLENVTISLNGNPLGQDPQSIDVSSLTGVNTLELIGESSVGGCTYQATDEFVVVLTSGLGNEMEDSAMRLTHNMNGYYLTTTAQEAYSLTMYDVSGRVIWNANQLLSTTPQFIPLPQESGLYLLRVENENNAIETFKLIR